MVWQCILWNNDSVLQHFGLRYHWWTNMIFTHNYRFASLALDNHTTALVWKIWASAKPRNPIKQELCADFLEVVLMMIYRESNIPFPCDTGLWQSPVTCCCVGQILWRLIQENIGVVAIEDISPWNSLRPQHPFQYLSHFGSLWRALSCYVQNFISIVWLTNKVSEIWRDFRWVSER